MSDLVLHEDRLRVEVDPQGVAVEGGPSGPLAVIGIGTQGPAGPPGPVGPSGGSGFTRTSSSAISGHRIVRSTGASSVDLCSASDLTHKDVLLGLTMNAASPGDPLTVVNGGEVVEPTWSWTPGLPIFCGLNGALTQTFDPGWAWVRIVAVATSATTIVVGLREPMILSP